MLRVIRSWASNRRFKAFVAASKAAEARAKERGDTQAVHRVRKARYDAVHASLGRKPQ